MACSKCRNGLPGGLDRCPACGAPNPASEATAVVRTPDATPSGTPVGPHPILGVVVTYSDTAPASPGPDPKWGRLYALREGDALLFGKSRPPAEVEIEEGTAVRVTTHHFYPVTKDYTNVSRRHALIQMLPGGTTLITDFSMNGIYVEGIEEHWQLASGARSQTHVVRGNQSLYLAVDLSEIAAERDPHSRFRVQIIRFDAPGAGGKATVP